MPEDKTPENDDSFWNIETLMPRSRSGRRIPSGAKSAPPSKPENDGVSSLQSDGLQASRPAKAPFSEKAANAFAAGSTVKGELAFPPSEPENVYTRTDGVVRRVEVYAWPNAYAFFGGFRKNALAILHMQGKEAPFVPFFSFMPQYHQLTASQLRYYLYWRGEVIAGTYPKTDFSYLLLYIYEILNLPDRIEPQIGADRLCQLWLQYRKPFPKLDKYLSEWLPDYCLCHNVRPGKKLFAKVAPYGRLSSTFKDFFLTDEEVAHPDLLLSEYSYLESKYRTEENAALFDEHVPAAMERFFAFLRSEESRAPAVEQVVRRTTFDGAVCVYSQKKRLEIRFLPVQTTQASAPVTDAVKYCENCVRAHLGIRARLAAPSLTQPMRKVIEGYFAEKLPSPAVLKSTAQEYLSKYDAPEHGFSFETAARIEEQSLQVARRLGSVFEDDPVERISVTSAENGSAKASPGDEPAAIPKPGIQNGETPPAPAKDAQTRRALQILVRQGSAAFRAYAGSLGLLPATLAERINEEAYLRYGDAAVEETDGTFAPLNDYEEEIAQWTDN